MTEKISRHLLNTVNTFSDEKIGVIVYLSRKNALNGFEIVKEYPFINAVGVKIAAHELNRLASFKAVKFVTSSSKVFALSCGDDENETSVFQNRFSMTGKGVGIAILDTGVSPHIDFACPKTGFRFLRISFRVIPIFTMITDTVLSLRELPRETALRPQASFRASRGGQALSA